MKFGLGLNWKYTAGWPVGDDPPAAGHDVPWLGPARSTKSSSAARTDGHHLIDHRGMSAPWLWPTMSTLRPDSAWIRCTARLTYSALICMSSSPRFGVGDDADVVAGLPQQDGVVPVVLLVARGERAVDEQDGLLVGMGERVAVEGGVEGGEVDRVRRIRRFAEPGPGAALRPMLRGPHADPTARPVASRPSAPGAVSTVPDGQDQEEAVTARPYAPIVPATRLVLVRHGESVAQAEGFLAGHAACRGLSDTGRRQAGALADRLAAGELGPVDALYCVGDGPGGRDGVDRRRPPSASRDPVIDCDLCELHPGDADGLTWAEIEQRWPTRFGTGWDPDEHLIDNAETWQRHARPRSAPDHRPPRRRRTEGRRWWSCATAASSPTP